MVTLMTHCTCYFASDSRDLYSNKETFRNNFNQSIWQNTSSHIHHQLEDVDHSIMSQASYHHQNAQNSATAFHHRNSARIICLPCYNVSPCRSTGSTWYRPCCTIVSIQCTLRCHTWQQSSCCSGVWHPGNVSKETVPTPLNNGDDLWPVAYQFNSDLLRETQSFYPRQMTQHWQHSWNNSSFSIQIIADQDSEPKRTVMQSCSYA